MYAPAQHSVVSSGSDARPGAPGAPPLYLRSRRSTWWFPLRRSDVCPSTTNYQQRRDAPLIARSSLDLSVYQVLCEGATTGALVAKCLLVMSANDNAAMPHLLARPLRNDSSWQWHLAMAICYRVLDSPRHTYPLFMLASVSSFSTAPPTHLPTIANDQTTTYHQQPTTN